MRIKTVNIAENIHIVSTLHEVYTCFSLLHHHIQYMLIVSSHPLLMGTQVDSLIMVDSASNIYCIAWNLLLKKRSLIIKIIELNFEFQLRNKKANLVLLLSMFIFANLDLEYFMVV